MHLIHVDCNENLKIRIFEIPKLNFQNSRPAEMNIERVPKTSTVTLENEISETTPLLPKEPQVPLGLRPSIGEEVKTEGEILSNLMNLISQKIVKPNHQWIQNV